MVFLGGQFKSATHGQFESAQGGQFDRILQTNAKILYICINAIVITVMRIAINNK